jgi:hypothetical protein
MVESWREECRMGGWFRGNEDLPLA